MHRAKTTGGAAPLLGVAGLLFLAAALLPGGERATGQGTGGGGDPGTGTQAQCVHQVECDGGCPMVEDCLPDASDWMTNRQALNGDYEPVFDTNCGTCKDTGTACGGFVPQACTGGSEL